MNEQEKPPICFAELETVFPMGEDGLRHTPENCMACMFKTSCLKTAMKSSPGMVVREEIVDRSYHAGVIGFWSRWSQKKTLNRKKKT